MKPFTLSIITAVYIVRKEAQMCVEQNFQLHWGSYLHVVLYHILYYFGAIFLFFVAQKAKNQKFEWFSRHQLRVIQFSYINFLIFRSTKILCLNLTLLRFEKLYASKGNFQLSFQGFLQSSSQTSTSCVAEGEAPFRGFAKGAFLTLSFLGTKFSLAVHMHYTQDLAPPTASCKRNCRLRETDRDFVYKTSNYWKSVFPLHQVQ